MVDVSASDFLLHFLRKLGNCMIMPIFETCSLCLDNCNYVCAWVRVRV